LTPEEKKKEEEKRKKEDEKLAEEKKEKEEKKKKADEKKKRYEKIIEEVSKLSSYVYEGMQDVNKKMGEVKDTVEVTVNTHTERIVRTIVGDN